MQHHSFRQRLFDFAAALSLLLCSATAALWARGLGHFELVNWRSARWRQSDSLQVSTGFLAWYSNTIRLEVTRVRFAPAYFAGLTEDNLRTFRNLHPPGVDWAFVGEDVTSFLNIYPAGFGYRRTSIQNGFIYEFALQPWLPTLLAALLPGAWFVHRRRAGAGWQFSLRDVFLGMTVLSCLLAGGLWLMH